MGLHTAKVKITGPVSSTRPPVVTCDNESSRLRVCAAPRLPCPFAPSSVSCPFPALCCVIDALLRQRLPPSSWPPAGFGWFPGRRRSGGPGGGFFTHSPPSSGSLPPPIAKPLLPRPHFPRGGPTACPSARRTEGGPPRLRSGLPRRLHFARSSL